MSTNMWDQQETVRLLKGAPGTMYQEADDVNKTIMRDWVRSLLQTQPITVIFTKADGTDREMKCTLNWGFIPAEEHPKPMTESVAKSRKVPEPEVFKVFDIDKKEWRSFRIDRLKKIVAELNFS